ncbi:LuxR C-terminal-related transcriptional regulator [Spongiactinospora sp. TRM90649]|uniref:LuxR C-terminal-related transcriptional regulator n=1 Tax=Spongiactinospora sp. TRM90649 TaxID=3031114 RepID=UPI0023F6CD75|nr:LuxR C-terminal-related transcriptional regulator [Spongiactinospora sp. TRM90649]MDF5754917.1 LuxR C-terminal-related transcriptional regulator [Spongiactinospora sp. TRM90649]
MTVIRERLRQGRRWLSRGMWERARREFEGALDAAVGDRERAQAAEGAAEAAWWLDDDARVSERYEQAYRAYRAAGDLVGAARSAAWLGNGALQLRGEDAVAQDWFRRAGRLLEGAPRGRERALLTLFEGMAARQRGDGETAIERAEEVVSAARGLGSSDLEVQGMALSGVARVDRGDVGEGMRLLDEAAAVALAGQTHEVGAVWMPGCYLVQGCVQARDWERAAQWSGRVMDLCRRLDLGSPFARCRTHYGTALLWQGRWPEAEEELTGAVRALSGIRPLFAAEARAQLGELRRRQGRRTEAGELFRAARTTPDGRLGLAELCLDEGDAGGAFDHARALLDGLPAQASLERCRALELLARAGARRSAGVPESEHARLLDAARELGGLAGMVGTDAVHASALWAAGLMRLRVLQESTGTEHAVATLRRATLLFERAGDAYNAARVRLDLAEALTARDRPGTAEEEAAAARETLVRLGGVTDARRAVRLLARVRHDRASALTTRQREILALVALGMTNKEIARRLALSEHTVKRHIANILVRLGLPSRTAAVAHASRAGLL